MPRVFNTTVEIRPFLNTNKEVPGLDITERVTKLFFKESLLNGFLEWSMTLAATQIDSEEEFMFETGIRQLRLSLLRDGVETTTGWRVIVVEKSSMNFIGGAPYVTITGSDLSVFLRGSHTWRSFINTSANVVAQTIARLHGLVPIVKISGEGTWYQLGQSDWELLQQLREEVTTLEGQRNSWLRVDNTVLRLEPLDYSRAPNRLYNLGGGDDRVEGVELLCNGRTAEYLGGSTTQTSGFNVLLKQTFDHFPNQVILPSLAGRLFNTFGFVNRYQTVATQNFKQLQDIGNIDWIEASVRHFGAHIRLTGDTGLRLGDLISIEILDPEGRRSAMRGTYPIYEIVHTYTVRPEAVEEVFDYTPQQGLTTHIVGFRRTFHFGDISVPSADFSGIKGVDTYSVNDVVKETPTVLISKEL